MSTHEQTADILDGAADVIERDGWHQGAYSAAPTGEWEGSAPACVLGAMNRAAGRNFWGDLLEAARRALGEAVGGGGLFHFTDWNDAPERTKQEVLDALRLAAKNERRLADSEAAS
jgi:hypothetical protein